MSTQVERAHGLEALGIVRSGPVHWNLSPAVLYEIAIRRNEAILASEGPLVARTGQHTGRSPQDKFTVKEPSTEQNVHWGMNKSVSEANFDALHRDMMTYVQDKELYVLDAWGGADPSYRIPVRIVTEFAWHNLFVRNMFIPELDPAKVGRFALVIACEVIEHVAHGDQFARQLMEFVAPGGHLLVTTPNGSHVRSKLPTYSQVTDFSALEALQFKPDADGHLYHLRVRPYVTLVVCAPDAHYRYAGGISWPRDLRREHRSHGGQRRFRVARREFMFGVFFP